MRKFRVLIKSEYSNIQETTMMCESIPEIGISGMSFGTEGLWELLEVIEEVE